MTGHNSFAREPMPTGWADLELMPDTPTQQAQHRRAHSETLFRFPDLDVILIDDELPPAPPSLVPNGPPPAQPGKSDGSMLRSHIRSLSMDADFFEGLGLDGKPSPAPVAAGDVVRRPVLRHSNSMDGYCSATSAEVELSVKKAMAADKLAELALIDPKRAKRIVANRQSAARSKERKNRYTSELERKVQTLQTEAINLSAQITVLQRDTSGVTAENKELKLKLQSMEQQAHLREALNEALRNELQHLRIAVGPLQAANGLSAQGPSLHNFTLQSQNNSWPDGLSFEDFNFQS
ncbi:basic-leucine zipper transcription factor family protein [Striga asiatica]|uniref:Basic-leucine zipper transcription factor family protein n=1 Tax=Striga asiatica TaxID=4170 RepID=A0A5A7PN46_STRAF|nr:basic-leucine zipper transcription factor family protein [Striga asiatica]